MNGTGLLNQTRFNWFKADDVEAVTQIVSSVYSSKGMKLITECNTAVLSTLI